MTRAHTLARTTSRLLVTLGLLAVPGFSQVTPSGPEVKVSGSPESRQRYPAVAARKDGFLLVWEDDVKGVQARKLAATGRAQGAATVLVATDPLPPERPFHGNIKEAGDPAVAVKVADGSFLLVWVERTVERSLDIFVDQRSVLSQRLRARRFTAAGKPLAGAAGNILELAPAAGWPGRPAVAVNPDGSFWIVWDESGNKRGGIHLRRLDAQGKLGPDVRIATVAKRNPVAASLNNAAIALGGDGFIVTWEQCCQAGGDPQVYARLLKPTGAPNGPAFKVPTLPGRANSLPAVAGRAGKEFLVVWQSRPQDGSAPPSIHGQLIAKTGALVQAEEVFAAIDDVSYLEPAVAATTDRNGWLVLWSVYESGKRSFVDGRSYDAQLNPTSNVVHFSTGQLYTLGNELAVAVMPNGRLVVSYVGSTEDRQVGIRARAGRSPVRK